MRAEGRGQCRYRVITDLWKFWGPHRSADPNQFGEVQEFGPPSHHIYEPEDLFQKTMAPNPKLNVFRHLLSFLKLSNCSVLVLKSRMRAEYSSEEALRVLHNCHDEMEFQTDNKIKELEDGSVGVLAVPHSHYEKVLERPTFGKLA